MRQGSFWWGGGKGKGGGGGGGRDGGGKGGMFSTVGKKWKDEGEEGQDDKYIVRKL